MKIRPRKGVLKDREVSKHRETLSLASLWRVLEAQRAIEPGEKKKKKLKLIDNLPNGNSRRRSSRDTHICH